MPANDPIAAPALRADTAKKPRRCPTSRRAGNRCGRAVRSRRTNCGGSSPSRGGAGSLIRSTKTKRYLLKHAPLLDARGSKIYQKNGRFAVFGVGDYSFSPFKVAISGLYKVPQFVVLTELGGKASMVDDTACFLSFGSREDAEVVAGALNSPVAKEFLSVFAFSDAKRPYTVEVLSKINLKRLVEKNFGKDSVPKILRPVETPKRLRQTEMFV